VDKLLVPLVSIVWDDADAHAEWENELEETEDYVHSVGFLIKETKSAYSIAHSVYMDGDKLTWNGRFRIPKGMCKSFTVLVGTE
jgi:hypothetical protein